jgi:hydroxyacylglutathione hydrolase
MEIKSYTGGYDSNIFYIVSSENEALVIDCFDSDIVLDYLKKNNLKLKYIISTHNHFDHVEANKELLEKTDAKLVMHKSNDCDLPVDEGSKLKLGSSSLSVLYTPGHTMDSVCFLLDENLFTGDTLFVKTIGGIFCPQGSSYQPDSIKKIMSLKEDIVVYPGHDYGGQKATIKEIKEKNNKVRAILGL